MNRYLIRVSWVMFGLMCGVGFNIKLDAQNIGSNETILMSEVHSWHLLTCYYSTGKTSNKSLHYVPS